MLRKATGNRDSGAKVDLKKLKVGKYKIHVRYRNKVGQHQIHVRYRKNVKLCWGNNC